LAGAMTAARMGRYWVEPPKHDMPTYAARWHAKQIARATHAAQIAGLKTPSQKRTGYTAFFPISFDHHQQKSLSHRARGWLCVRAWVRGACVCNEVDAPCTRPSTTWLALRSQTSSTSPWRNTWRREEESVMSAVAAGFLSGLAPPELGSYLSFDSKFQVPSYQYVCKQKVDRQWLCLRSSTLASTHSRKRASSHAFIGPMIVWLTIVWVPVSPTESSESCHFYTALMILIVLMWI
jgi:hypothetical protein